ncbi:hypothetical protein F3Y22_tig00110954pilonHSYRG00215 [Hibiscus syriacus]|uniref:Uncharacterized protein n=1 Tax=Hibiscus syriacus TaxID=106335 RepID=A0A6A2ZBD5_HIBSY|nr:hypothetical protein F3Y22_tig00110954pilonHSYRG00215 [Hibiscus syriacus]
MAVPFLISHVTSFTFFYFLLLSSSSASSPTAVTELNITSILSSFRNFTSFASLFSFTSVLSDLTRRQDPITLLAVPNSTSPLPLPPISLAASLRPHSSTSSATHPPKILLLDQPPPDPALRRPPLQTRPFCPNKNAALQYHDPRRQFPPRPVRLQPNGFRNPPPLGLNITKALIDGHNFNVAAALLSSSGVVDEFEADEEIGGSKIPRASYLLLGSLESIVNPVQPTLATEDSGAGSFTLNISRVNGSVAIDTGIVQASVTQTVLTKIQLPFSGFPRFCCPERFLGKILRGIQWVGRAVHPRNYLRHRREINLVK